MTIEHLYGRRPVLEALRARRRTLHELMVAEGSSGGIIEEIITAAEKQGVTVRAAPSGWLDDRLRGAGNHQGVMLAASGYPYVNLEDVLALAGQRGEPPLVLLLDLLQDVQNIGTLLRTAEAVGVHGVVIQERRSARVTPAVVSASSGAVEHLRVAQVTNLVNTMGDLKEQSDIWIAGLDQSEGAQRFDRANLKGAMGLVVGSEGSGLRRLVRETCDYLIYLPMRGSIASLNAATAGSIALYELWRARDFS
ncbi:MAG: 23S rRNA (guanosine(2251)-2'-O)-methyltransferase RlmB [Chloroflexi bacterium]|nr:23S rRNA (guanosine(2251)-2'-O)-methyltransferase RlmB [Chloroflexota bacterium]